MKAKDFTTFKNHLQQKSSSFNHINHHPPRQPQRQTSNYPQNDEIPSSFHSDTPTKKERKALNPDSKNEFKSYVSSNQDFFVQNEVCNLY